MKKTKGQIESSILSYVNTYTATHGVTPSIRTIASGTGIPRTTVQRYLVALGARGDIQYTDGALETPVTEKFRHDTVPVALLGEVACGLPAYEEEHVEAYMRFPRELLGEGEYYLLRARGDSMVEVGIEAGDLVVVKKQDTATRGQIAVVLVDGEVTLKRYFPEPEHRRIRLHPENSTMEDIYVDQAQVQGVAVRVWKELA